MTTAKLPGKPDGGCMSPRCRLHVCRLGISWYGPKLCLDIGHTARKVGRFWVWDGLCVWWGNSGFVASWSKPLDGSPRIERVDKDML